MEEDPDSRTQAAADAITDRNVRLVGLAVWAVGLAAVLVRGLDLFMYAFLTAYVLGILYALHLRQVDDPEGVTAIWWALIVPPLAWWTFLLHWLEHRGTSPNLHGDEPTQTMDRIEP
jgi:hypothetical protein